MNLSLLAALALSATIPLNSTIDFRNTASVKLSDENGQVLGAILERTPQIKIPITGSVDTETGIVTINGFSYTVPAQSYTRMFATDVTVESTPDRTTCDASGCVTIPGVVGGVFRREFTFEINVPEMHETFPTVTARLGRYTEDQVFLTWRDFSRTRLDYTASLTGPTETDTLDYGLPLFHTSTLWKHLEIERDESGQVVDYALPAVVKREVLLGAAELCADDFCPEFAWVVPEPSAAMLLLLSAPLLGWLRNQ